MKPLPKTLRKNGFAYTQILRGEKTCIYVQRFTDNLNYYEVFKIKIKPKTVFKNKIIAKREVYPNNEAFGKWAWTYRDYEKAFKKFTELEGKKNEEKINPPRSSNLTDNFDNQIGINKDN